jgi:hypothetical protein
VTDNREPADLRPVRALHIALARLLENDIYLWMTREEFVIELEEATNGAVSQDHLMKIYAGLMSEAGVEPMLSESDRNHDWKPRKTIEEKLEEFKK